MTDVATALREAAAALAAASDTPRLDAEWLMADALGATRSELLLRHMRDPAPEGFAASLARRLAGEPVAYILGHAEFWGLELEVGPGVLIPRADSETLIAAAQACFAAENRAPAHILDLGSGSGCLLLAALSIWPEAEGHGIERSERALPILLRNCMRHANPWARAIVGGDPRMEAAPAVPPRRPDRGTFRITQRDWTQAGWAEGLGRFDLILANPPYVEAEAPLAPSVRDHEPHGALFAGAEGLDDYLILLPRLPMLLAPGGIALVEIGHAQASAVTRIAEASGLAARLHRDLAGRDRALELRGSGLVP